MPAFAPSVRAVRERIAAACDRGGRDPVAVTLVGVTKSVGPAEALGLLRLGVADLAENRPARIVEMRAAVEAARREAVSLGEDLPEPRWHMIGHFQRNKIRRAVGSVDILHSGDSLRLLQALETELDRRRTGPMPVLLQVNVSGEATKGGFEPSELPAVLECTAGLGRVHVTGLMTMAPAGVDPSSVRPVFRRLRELRDQANRQGYLEIVHLSMGMSDDLDVAVEEGATLVRVGTALFRGAGGVG